MLIRITTDNPNIEYVGDILTVDNRYENDKMMHNRGYMKGLTTVLVNNSIIAPALLETLRRIVGIFSFHDYDPHYIRFKSVLPINNKKCMMDYIEMVPKSEFNPASGDPEGRE